ncbi:MAG: TetR family transcriptional regulator [Terracidiphilus sp.]|jgi:TetR/AcrR family transcriptional regulator
MTSPTPSRTQAERADQTRARILDAAMRQFSENGLAGARTELIAEEAGVNKALLYYYFSSKQALYEAALEAVANNVVTSSMAAIDAGYSAGERLLHFALNHFDRIHTQRAFQSLMQQEMIRLHRGEENALAPLLDKVFRPMMARMRQVFAEGSASGELIQVDEMQMMYAALGANVFYFLSAPVMGLLTGTNPLERGALEHRRKAAIEYLGQTVFTDRAYGALVAARVIASTPMPPEAKTDLSEPQTPKMMNSDIAQVLQKADEVRRK